MTPFPAPPDAAGARTTAPAALRPGTPGRARPPEVERRTSQLAVALIGNHTPRQCGIATFTADLTAALGAVAPEFERSVLAMNDGNRRYAYPDEVRFELAADDLGAYRRAADFLNAGRFDVASLQHEYGIFGGPAGSHVLTLLRALRMPIVTTLHTILAEPNAAQRAVMDELVSLSERLVVMSERGAELLRTVHAVPADRIDYIPHGIAALPDDGGSKARLGLAGRPVLLTFGLLSPDKGLEFVIDALPAIAARLPDVVYVVLGATHPHVRDREGEAYRRMLEDRARRGGVADRVVFHDRFVSQAELNEFLAAADVYLTPYLVREQITSGTLAFAVGSGKAVVSTPYWYATELLADGRGELVPWRDAGAIASASLALLTDPAHHAEVSRRAGEYGRAMQWPAVARTYVACFDRACFDRGRRGRAPRRRDALPARAPARPPAALPTPDWSHLRRLTDDTGLLQHAEYTTARREEGYCLDDNARALLVLALAEPSSPEDRALAADLSARYLAFVRHAWNGELGRFRNFLSYGRTWLEDAGSEDSHGRAIWALGTVVGRAANLERCALPGSLLRAALPALGGFTSPRAWAYALLGIDEYLRAFPGESDVRARRASLSERLHALHRAHATPDWPWFEDSLTYCSARLSQALVVSGAGRRRDDLVETGLASLAWLARVQRSDDGCFAPVGSNGFYPSGGPRARFDQQPVEAASMVSACLAAHGVTGDERWLGRARRAFDWFVGRNDLQQSLYDPVTGGCRDGLHADRPNENQGAESTLSFLLALVELRAAETAPAGAGATSIRSSAVAGPRSESLA